MIVTSITQVKELLLGKSLKICLIDNNSVEFFLRIKEQVDIKQLFEDYDLVLIPGWIKTEIEDSEYRKNYVNELKQMEAINFSYIDELDYIKLVDYKDAILFNFFLYSCGSIKPLESFIKRNILKNKPIEELDDYQIWLDTLYKEGFKGEIITNGRERKKNAGEISICVLSLILAFFYMDNIENITIFTNDRDTYDFNKYAINKMYSNKDYRAMSYKSITFKSNDFLIYELFNKKLLNIVSNNELSRLRNPKWVTYTRKKHDNSIEEGYRLIENEEFMEMLRDSTLYIAF